MAARYYRNFETAADLDAAYDVEKSVPDFSVFATQYVAASEAARRALRNETDVRYGPTRAEYCDLFPAAAPGSPIVVFIHGGYWRILSAREFSFCAPGPVAAGCAVVVANYALCPEVTIGEIVRQMRALIVWVRANARRFNGDPDSIWVVGHSAGGHLAAMCALTDWPTQYGLPERTVSGIMPISGLFDLDPLRHSWLQPDLRLTEDDVQRYSPQRLVRRVTAPMVISYGGDDPSAFAGQSSDFLEAWRRCGNAGEFFPQIARNHFNAITDLAEPEAPVTAALMRLVGRRPRPAARPASRAPGVDRRLFPRARTARP